MNPPPRRPLLLSVINRLWVVPLFGVTMAWGGPPGGDEAVLVTCVAETNPVPQIVLSFPPEPLADASRKIVGYRIHRRARGEDDWKPIANALPPDTTQYTNSGSDVTVESGFEYRVTRMIRYNAGVPVTLDLHSFVCAGIEVPPEKNGCDTNHGRGKILLVVDNSMVSSLASDLSVLERDLAGDGWTVQRIDFPRGVAPNNRNGSPNPAYARQVTQLRSLIQSAYSADPSRVNAVFLLGHLPVPYSGSLSPDGHTYRRSWPTDTYYGSVTNGTENPQVTWTDTRLDLDATPPFTARNSNHPGDGKFDNDYIPTPMRLSVGRVDLSDMPAFQIGETELLRRYLKKDHAYRNGITRYESRALILNQFPCHNRQWPTFTSFYGKARIEDVVNGDWFPRLGQGTYQWAFGANFGDGSCESMLGVGSTTDFASRDAKVVFTTLFGSFFLDWDIRNSLLRAPLGNKDTLTCSWHADDRCFDSLTPNWIPPLFHPMAMGETIGYSVRLTQNYTTAYRKHPNLVANRPVHISLMGDPTLRLHVVSPPANLTARVGTGGTVNLNWSSSPESRTALKGYYLYRAADPKGPFTLLNRTSPVDAATTSFVDTAATQNERWYMVRADKLETSASGTYHNLSQGAFAQAR